MPDEVSRDEVSWYRRFQIAGAATEKDRSVATVRIGLLKVEQDHDWRIV